MKTLYDGFEVQLVGEFNNGGDNFCESIEFADDREAMIEEAIQTFWTVYGHLPEGGVEAIADFHSEKDADRLCDFLNHLLKKAGLKR